MTQRTDRLGEVIKEELSQIIRTKLRDPRIGFITITGVKVSPDLRHAIVYFSVLGDESKLQESLQGLESSKGFLRTELGNRVRMKYLPELDFKLDSSIKEGIRIAEIINHLHREEEKNGR